MKYLLLLIVTFSCYSYSDSRGKLVALKSCAEFPRSFEVAENESFDGGESYTSREFVFYGVGAQAILTCKEGSSNNLLIITKHSEFEGAKYHFSVIYNELKHLYGVESIKDSTSLAKFDNKVKPPSEKGFDSREFVKQWKGENENKLYLSRH